MQTADYLNFRKEDFNLHLITEAIKRVSNGTWFGRVCGVTGLMIEVEGLDQHVVIGSIVLIEIEPALRGEVVGFSHQKALVMVFGNTERIGLQTRVGVLWSAFWVFPHKSWKGRVLNGMAEPIDGKGHLFCGKHAYQLKNAPLKPCERQLLGKPIDFGLKAMNTFLMCLQGQRMGLFAGSGVGKTTLLQQMMQQNAFDVVVVGLVGERGREAVDFIQKHMSSCNKSACILVVATSDQPPLLRRQAAYLTMTIAEYFRNQGENVLCMIDSITRFANAQREIGLACHEPPTGRGYPPSVFSELAHLLERARPGTQGYMTGLFTVLVDGDDFQEPICDTVRGILDGHIILNRSIAERGRFPCIDVLKSVSRVTPDCYTTVQKNLIQKAKKILSTYQDMEELIRMGAYRMGSSPEIDQAIHLFPALDAFIAQEKFQSFSTEQSFWMLENILQNV